MLFRNAALAATLLAAPCAAWAQPLSGIYVGGGAGLNIMQDADSTRSSNFGTAHGNLETRVGPALSLSVGYALGNGFRAEVEGAFRYNTFQKTNTGDTAGGREQKYGPMVNVLYDVNGLLPVVTPYVGVGAGYQWVQEDNNRVGSTVRVKNGTAGAFAYQGIVGAALPIAGVPGLAVTADYRFMGLAGDRDYSGTVTRGAATVPASIKRNDDYNHSILLGVRYAFGAAPANPVAPTQYPVPVSAASRSYLVFFDWDKASLTDRARQIVAEAAANSVKVQYTRLEVNGYTDTSGTQKYNMGLSIRRAQSVAAELVKDGVPKGAITIQGFGETHLLVPTGPGVREPQNRRVEIVIR